MRSAKQREATKRWLANPEVKEIQREKARIRAQKKKVKDTTNLALYPSNVTHTPDPVLSAPSGSSSPSSHFLPTQAVHLNNNASLTSLRQEIDAWKIDWEFEGNWSTEFEHALHDARLENGVKGADQFFRECQKHASEGRRILRGLKKVARGSWKGGEKSIREQVIQLQEMLLEVACEVKFFEIKYAENTPAIPLWKISELQYHNDFM
ncbi:hypothetical protein BJ138DRAFT_1120131 [Hygrophoropsis aurantiaca]|uniref:Uncharacterized protein n=1 Tax=Hygrophoropsis aurantiaca TaxID=72124 RepID=A0ACB7ZSH8_9AGAM|nr:hypothetical protein BJ138DRAFT_1120131 [Hygrophoropsis aurantiaca]